MEDYQIVDLYWARSESAIDQTSKKYGRMLMGISVSLLSSSEDAEECVNDTYLSAWQRMPDERPIYLGAFLSKIVRSISIDRYRRIHSKKRGGAGMLMEELSECMPSDYSVEAEYDNERLASALNSFLMSLDEEKRYIFIRRYYYSDSISDISRNMKIGEGKIKTVLFRCRKALKKYLEEEGIEL